jgi:hypothetical protein
VQSGFRAGHGYTSATFKVLNDIITAIDKRQYCAAVFINLAKAFDSITVFLSADSTTLVSQMTASPGSPTTSQIEFSVSDWLSGPQAVPMGLPQGSILGPTLFSVYIKDVALAAGDSLIHLYADDTILYTSGPSLDSMLTNLQTSFNAIQHSFLGLQLLLNYS